MKLGITLLLAWTPTLLFAGGAIVDLQFNDPEKLGLQSVPGSEDFQVVGDVSSLGGIVSLGTSGYLTLPNYSHPKGPFTVEVRLKIRKYAPESTRHISDFISSATWDDGPTQGFAFRVGGGYLYPLASREAYNSEEDWIRSQQLSSHTSIAHSSKCIGAFVTAMKNNDRDWKNGYTTSCMELGEWTHAVGVFNGESLRFFLNGMEATDNSRSQNHSAQSFFADSVPLFIGARTGDGFDSRHLDGDLDFVRILDTAMSDAQIQERYLETLDEVELDEICQGSIRIQCPVPLQWADGKTSFKFEWGFEGRCEFDSLAAALIAGDRLQLQFSLDESFEVVMAEVKFDKTQITLAELGLEELSDHRGTVFWRVRLIPKEDLAEGLRKRAATESSNSWSLARPLFLETNSLSIHRAPLDAKPPILNISSQGRDALGLRQIRTRGGVSKIQVIP
jgi:hypothetical protein